MWRVVRFESIESIRQYLQPPLVATCGRVDFNRDGSKGVDSTTFSTTLSSYLRNISQVSCKLTSGTRFHLMRDGLSDFRLTTNQLPVEQFANCLWRIVAVWVYLKTLLQLFWPVSSLNLNIWEATSEAVASLVSSPVCFLRKGGCFMCFPKSQSKIHLAS